MLPVAARLVLARFAERALRSSVYSYSSASIPPSLTMRLPLILLGFPGILFAWLGIRSAHDSPVTRFSPLSCDIFDHDSSSQIIRAHQPSLDPTQADDYCEFSRSTDTAEEGMAAKAPYRNRAGRTSELNMASAEKATSTSIVNKLTDLQVVSRASSSSVLAFGTSLSAFIIYNISRPKHFNQSPKKGIGADDGFNVHSDQAIPEQRTTPEDSYNRNEDFLEKFYDELSKLAETIEMWNSKSLFHQSEFLPENDLYEGRNSLLPLKPSLNLCKEERRMITAKNLASIIIDKLDEETNNHQGFYPNERRTGFSKELSGILKTMMKLERNRKKLKDARQFWESFKKKFAVHAKPVFDKAVLSKVQKKVNVILEKDIQEILHDFQKNTRDSVATLSSQKISKNYNGKSTKWSSYKKEISKISKSALKKMVILKPFLKKNSLSEERIKHLIDLRFPGDGIQYIEYIALHLKNFLNDISKKEIMNNIFNKIVIEDPENLQDFVQKKSRDIKKKEEENILEGMMQNGDNWEFLDKLIGMETPQQYYTFLIIKAFEKYQSQIDIKTLKTLETWVRNELTKFLSWYNLRRTLKFLKKLLVNKCFEDIIFKEIFDIDISMKHLAQLMRKTSLSEEKYFKEGRERNYSRKDKSEISFDSFNKIKRAKEEITENQNSEEHKIFHKENSNLNHDISNQTFELRKRILKNLLDKRILKPNQYSRLSLALSISPKLYIDETSSDEYLEEIFRKNLDEKILEKFEDSIKFNQDRIIREVSGLIFQELSSSVSSKLFSFKLLKLHFFASSNAVLKGISQHLMGEIDKLSKYEIYRNLDGLLHGKYEHHFHNEIIQATMPHIKIPSTFLDKHNGKMNTKMFDLFLCKARIPQDSHILINMSGMRFEGLNLISNSDMRAEEFFRNPLKPDDPRLRGTIFQNLPWECINKANGAIQFIFKMIPDLMKTLESEKVVLEKIGIFVKKKPFISSKLLQIFENLNSDFSS